MDATDRLWGVTPEDRRLLADTGWQHDLSCLGLRAPSATARRRAGESGGIEHAFLEMIDRALAPLVRPRALAMPCGHGVHAHYLLLHGAATVVGIDPDAEAIARASLLGKVLAHEARLKLNVAPLTSDALRALEGSFGIAVASHGWLRQPDVAGWLRALRERVDGGVVLRTRFVRDERPPGRFVRAEAAWDNRWSERALAALIEEAGFHLVEEARLAPDDWAWRLSSVSPTRPAAS